MFKVCILAGCVALSLGYHTGAPLEVCETMTPGHGYTPQSVKPPYTIFVSSSSYWPGNNILVTLNATYPEVSSFKGFLVMARRADCTDPDVPIGRFINMDDDYQYQVKTCPKGKYTHNAVTHTTGDNKMHKSFLWYNPEGGDVYFKFSIVNQKDTYWTNIKSGVVSDSSRSGGDVSCADPQMIHVEYVDPARLSTRSPYTTMANDHGNNYYTDTAIVWPVSGNGTPELTVSFSLMLAVAVNLFL